jgi:hypothetical protein
MRLYSVHFSSWHDLYYVIETQSDRGRVVFAHAWRICAQYVAERLQSEQSLEEGAGTCPDIQGMLATTQPNAPYRSSATGALRQPRPFERVGRVLLGRFRRRLSRLLPHSLRSQGVSHSPRPAPAHRVEMLIDQRPLAAETRFTTT